jgi:cysteine desulfurase / selenocysteine lyase
MLSTKQVLDVVTIKKDFPLFAQYPSLTYLDSASTSHKPHTVLAAMQKYYTTSNANIHRGVYKLSEKSTVAYEQARHAAAQFIHATDDEIIFTSGTTEGLNLLASSLGKTLQEGDEIVLTEMEHHSNLVPWQQVAKEKKCIMKFIPLTTEGRLDMDVAEQMITKKTKIVAVCHMSNALGTINPVKELATRAHAQGAVCVVDGAQGAAHMPVDVKALDCDYYAFSGHKMLGPTGIGVLYGKKELLENLSPFLYGGDMIREVGLEDSTWNDVPFKFEAGTQHLAGAVGLHAAVDYLSNLSMECVQEHEQQLTAHALERLQTLEGVTVYGPLTSKDRGGVISFVVKGVHPHDVCAILDQQGVAVRGGHHCAMPLMKKLGVDGTTRLSFSVYNSFEDVDKVMDGLHNVKKVFGT